jgi:hypothetical protein
MIGWAARNGRNDNASDHGMDGFGNKRLKVRFESQADIPVFSSEVAQGCMLAVMT